MCNFLNLLIYSIIFPIDCIRGTRYGFQTLYFVVRLYRRIANSAKFVIGVVLTLAYAKYADNCVAKKAIMKIYCHFVKGLI